MRKKSFHIVLFTLVLFQYTSVIGQDVDMLVSGDAKINLSGEVKISLSGESSSFQLEDDADFEDATKTALILEGDFTNNTNFVTFQGNLVFDGRSPQNLLGSTAIRNLTISNNSSLNIFGPVLVNNQLVLQQSNITTVENDDLTLEEEVNITIIGIGSFVNGPLRIRANGTTGNILNFPIGKNSSYFPLRLRLDQTNSTGLYTAEAFSSNIPSNDLAPSLQSVSTSKYWTISSSESIANAYIELPVEASDNVTSAALARIARSANSTWTNLGGINLSSIPGTLRSSIAFSDFGDFIIASAAPNNDPSIASITPDRGKVGDVVTITGSNLETTPGTIKFGDVTVSSSDIISWTDTEIQVRVPQGLNAGDNATLEITVNGASSAINFDFIFIVQDEGNCNDFTITNFPKGGNIITVGSNTALSVEVSDASLVNTAQIYYRGISQENWQGPINVNSSGNEFTYQVNDGVDDIGLEYYFEFSFSGCANVTSNTAYAYLYYPNGVSIPGLTSGNTAGDYNLFSIPLDLDNATVNNVLDELGTYDKTKWRLFRVQNGSYQEFGSFSFEPGRGYLLIFDQSQNFNTGPGSTVAVTKDNPYQMSLRQGWNMIATPYPFPIQWADVLSQNSISTLGDFFNYSSTGYTEGNGILAPFRGAIWFAETATNISVSPIKDNSLSGGRVAANNRLKERPNANNWELDLLLKDNVGSSIKGAIGMREGASLSKDNFDGMRPPIANFHSSFHFEHTEYFYPYFLKDIVPNGKKHEWEFEVTPSLESTALSLNWNKNLINELDLKIYLQDLNTGFYIDMSQSDSYSFTAKQNGKFKIILGSGSISGGLLIGDVFPNPASQQINIPFSLPIGNTINKAFFTVFDMTGKKIISRKVLDLAGGYQELQLNFLDKNLSKGLYLLSVALESNNEIKEKTLKFLIR